MMYILQVEANPDDCDEFGPVPPEPSDSEVELCRKGEENYDPEKIKAHWNKRLTSFQKLVFIKAFKEEKVRRLHYFILFHFYLSFIRSSPNKPLAFHYGEIHVDSQKPCMVGIDISW